MLKVDTKDLKTLCDNLRNTSKKAYPLAVRSTLNRQAFETSKEVKKNQLKKTFILRNAYIQKTVGYQRSENVFEVSAMESFAGQFDKFAGKKTNQLEHQEMGKPVVAKGKYTKAPTLSARGGTFAKKIKKGALFNSLKNKKIQKINDIAMYPSKFELNQAVKIAQKWNEEFILVSTTQKGIKGVFKVNKKGVKLLYKFTDKANKIKKREWLKPVAEKILHKSDKIFIEEAERRIEKELSQNLKRL